MTVHTLDLQFARVEFVRKRNRLFWSVADIGNSIVKAKIAHNADKTEKCKTSQNSRLGSLVCLCGKHSKQKNVKCLVVLKIREHHITSL